MASEQWKSATTWTGVVAACALPVVHTLWRMTHVSEYASIAAGVLAWNVAMVAIAARRRSRNGGGGLVRAGTIYAMVQGLVALAAPAPAVLVLYLPAVWAAGGLILRNVDAGSEVSAFVLTLACGAQVLVCLLGIERLIMRVQQGRSRS